MWRRWCCLGLLFVSNWASSTPVEKHNIATCIAGEDPLSAAVSGSGEGVQGEEQLEATQAVPRPRGRGLRLGKVAKVALPVALMATMVSGVDGGIISCPTAPAICQGGCVALMYYSCSTAGMAWIGFFSSGVVGPVLATMCTVGAPATTAACNTACIAAMCSPLTP